MEASANQGGFDSEQDAIPFIEAIRREAFESIEDDSLSKLSVSLHKIKATAAEFISDWKKGDFDLGKLATCDANSMEEALLSYEYEWADFLKQANAVIDSKKT